MEFLQHLSWFTICSGLITIIAAIVTFLLTQLSFKDGRKNFLGFKGKALKEYASYITLFFAFLTLFIQSRHDFQDSEEKRIKERKADSTQQANVDTTLKAINGTLKAQKITQDSTQIVLGHQRTELKNEGDILHSEKKSLDNYAVLLKGQRRVIDSLNLNLGLTHGSVKTQEKNTTLLDSTADRIQSLNFPIANNVGAMCKIRIYVKGIPEIWTDSVSGSHLIIRQNSVLQNFVESRIGKLQANDLIPYWRFFFSFSRVGFDHVMAIDSKLTKISFDDYKGIDPPAGSYVSQSDIYYNAKESYFEITVGFADGEIASNTTNVDNFARLINKSDLFVRLRYVADKEVNLPLAHNKSKTITIDHIQIASVTQINYGNGLQNVFAATPELIPEKDKQALAKTLWGDDIPNSELWRYDVIKIPIIKK